MAREDRVWILTKVCGTCTWYRVGTSAMCKQIGDVDSVRLSRDIQRQTYQHRASCSSTHWLRGRMDRSHTLRRSLKNNDKTICNITRSLGYHQWR